MHRSAGGEGRTGLRLGGAFAVLAVNREYLSRFRPGLWIGKRKEAADPDLPALR